MTKETKFNIHTSNGKVDDIVNKMAKETKFNILEETKPLRVMRNSR